MDISGNYRELKPEEVADVVARYGDAWQDPNIPALQYEMAVQSEMKAVERGQQIAPFAALRRCLLALPKKMNVLDTTLLDVGAASGYYSQVLSAFDFHYRYVALDFSPHFRDLAKRLYPTMAYDVGDARALPYPANSFDIVLSGAVMLHVAEYEKVIEETARVTRDIAIFHRTPTLGTGPTKYFLKEAYGVPCLEIHFGLQELFALFEKYDLDPLVSDTVFWDAANNFGHRTFMLRKRQLGVSSETLLHHSV